MLTLERLVGSRLLLSVVLVLGLFSNSAAENSPSDSPQPSTTGWKIKFDESGSGPVMADGVLYIGSADGAVYALDPKTGATKWRFQTGEDLPPATSGGQVITVPRGTSTIDQMVAGMKAAEKQKEQGMRRVDMTPAVENGTVFVGSGDHLFYAIDAATGKKKWSYDIGYAMASNTNSSSPVPPLVVSDDVLYFATGGTAFTPLMRSRARGSGYLKHGKRLILTGSTLRRVRFRVVALSSLPCGSTPTRTRKKVSSTRLTRNRARQSGRPASADGMLPRRLRLRDWRFSQWKTPARHLLPFQAAKRCTRSTEPMDK